MHACRHGRWGWLFGSGILLLGIVGCQGPFCREGICTVRESPY